MHVVGGFYLIPKWGTPEYQLGVSDADEVSEVRVSVRKLLDGQRTGELREVFVQIRFQPFNGQFLALSHRRPLIELGSHRAPPVGRSTSLSVRCVLTIRHQVAVEQMREIIECIERDSLSCEEEM